MWQAINSANVVCSPVLNTEVNHNTTQHNTPTVKGEQADTQQLTTTEPLDVYNENLLQKMNYRWMFNY
ncbi:hypothetical protein E2C01_076134 [Portunus trituberculatus]|uniref:Uncharacterized protein n=1 Tax=Portunus trituberculatus TaxID=210409 RepID=A0A5B7IGQ5_PORTR|nr:hypothetical protein [Portunus trituberculatus]